MVTATGPVRADDRLERAVLGGGIALDCASLYADRLRAEDFADPRHGAIWAATLEAQRLASLSRVEGQSAEPVTVRAVAAVLRARRRLNATDGERYLHSLVPYAPSDVGQFAALVRELSGLALARRVAIVATRIATFAADESVDPDELARRVLRETSQAITRPEATGAVAIDDVLGEIWTDYERQGDGSVPHGVASTGLRALDALLGYLRESQLIVCGGRPGMGKTVFGLCSALASARMRRRVLYWSKEMARKELGKRLLANVASVSTSGLTRGRFTGDEANAVQAASTDLYSLREHLAILDRRTTAEDLVSATLREHQQSPLGLVVVDHLHIVRWSKRARSENDHITETTAELKELAKTLRAPVLLLAQLNRSLESRENKRPTLADFRASGSIEQDADVVIGLHREDYHSREASTAPGEAETIVLKHRDGAVGTIRARFEGQYSRFSDDAADAPPTYTEPSRDDDGEGWT